MGYENLLRRTGFLPFAELTQEQRNSLDEYLATYTLGKVDPGKYWWKSSEDNSWMASLP